MRTDFAKMAEGRWRQLLPALGIDSRFLTGKHCPCPICGGKDRFRWDNQHERGGYVCGACGAGDGFNLVMKTSGKSFKEVAEQVSNLLGHRVTFTPQGEDEADARNRAAMRRVWGEAMPIDENDPAAKYVTRRLGGPWFSPSLRYHPAMWHDGRRHPAMLAKIITHDDRAANIHVTYLTEQGHRANIDPAKKVMQGKLPDGCAIRLSDAAPVMGVAEGIETAMSASLMFDVPVWACVNGGLLAKWIPPEVAERVIVFGDNDENYTGQAKAYHLANRLEVQFKRKVTVMIPPRAGTDWNDQIDEEGAAPQRLTVVK